MCISKSNRPAPTCLYNAKKSICYFQVSFLATFLMELRPDLLHRTCSIKELHLEDMRVVVTEALNQLSWPSEFLRAINRV